MEPLLDPESEDREVLLWALREGLLSASASIEVVVERRRGGALVHTETTCSRRDPKVRSERVTLPLKDALDDPGYALQSKRGRKCSNCISLGEAGGYQAWNQLRYLRSQEGDFQAVAKETVEVLTRLHGDAEASLEGGDWDLLSNLSLRLAGAGANPGAAFGVDEETLRASMDAWLKKTRRPHHVLLELLEEAARSRRPKTVLEIVGAGDASKEDLAAEKVYLAQERRGSLAGCQHPEHSHAAQAIHWIWGIEVTAPEKNQEAGTPRPRYGASRTLSLLAVPKSIAPAVARWAGMVEVGPYSEEVHAELAEVAAQLNEDSTRDGLSKPSEILLAAAMVLGRDGFEITRHTDDEDTSPEPEWLRGLSQ